jgi:hypothetical protein
VAKPFKACKNKNHKKGKLEKEKKAESGDVSRPSKETLKGR